MSAAVSIVEPPAIRTCDDDGTHHISQVKKLADSGVQYLHAVNHPDHPTAAMILGSLVHFLVLGERKGAKRLLKYEGATRQGNAWKDFVAANDDAEILTSKEWAVGERIAAAVFRDPVARACLDGARHEVPLTWEDAGVQCSTSGVDIVPANRFGDLKTTSTTELRALQAHCFKMSYHVQLAWYRRGLRANGYDVSQGAFLLCVETKAPHEVVCLELSEDLLDLGDKTVTLLLEKLRLFKECDQWPGRAQTPVVWTVPAWMQPDEDEEEDDDATP